MKGKRLANLPEGNSEVKLFKRKNFDLLTRFENVSEEKLNKISKILNNFEENKHYLAPAIGTIFSDYDGKLRVKVLKVSNEHNEERFLVIVTHLGYDPLFDLG